MLVDGNNFISHFLKNNKPLAAGKIGVTELNLLYCFHHIKKGGELLPHLKHEVENIAGLYPYDLNSVNFFANEMLFKLKHIDLIPRWNKVIPDFENFIFNNYCPNAYQTKLEMLEPYFYDEPWTNHLEGKKVLVFSPFKESIQENYKNLNKIWNNKIKNNFELKVVQYPFALTISKNSEFSKSIDVYKRYLDILKSENFEVGIFGTGWTSLLFTLEAKLLNKTGIHLGGSTQILFGIKGQRWKEIDRFKNIFNDYWTDPKQNEKPEKLSLVEGGCYW